MYSCVESTQEILVQHFSNIISSYYSQKKWKVVEDLKERIKMWRWKLVDQETHSSSLFYTFFFPPFHFYFLTWLFHGSLLYFAICGVFIVDFKSREKKKRKQEVERRAVRKEKETQLLGYCVLRYPRELPTRGMFALIPSLYHLTPYHCAYVCSPLLLHSRYCSVM